jgi:hypothetical protein
MYLAMMEAAEADKVAKLRCAAVRPVFDVVAIDVFVVATAREAATLVAGVQCAA